MAADSELVSIASELSFLSDQLDRTGGHDEVMALLERMEALQSKIVAAEARSLDGLIVKAQATAWALDPDFDPLKEPSIHGRIVASIVRDLLRLGGQPNTVASQNSSKGAIIGDNIVQG